MELTINNKPHSIDADPAMPILWVLRDLLHMTGTKFGCGIAQCGACTVHLDGQPVRSCVTPVAAAEDRNITTIEGLSEDLNHVLHRAWLEVDVIQCGYCQTGQIMSAAVLLDQIPDPTDADIDQAMKGNICRCGTYQRIRKAIHTASRLKREEHGN